MRIFFQINDHPKEGKNSDSHGPKVIFLGTSGKQDYESHTALRNLSYLEEPQNLQTTKGCWLTQTKVRYLHDGSCSHLLALHIWCRSVIPGIGTRPGQALHTHLSDQCKAGQGQRYRIVKRDSLGSNQERSGTAPEEGRRSCSHHPENAGLEYRPIYHKMDSSVRASISKIKGTTYVFRQSG